MVAICCVCGIEKGTSRAFNLTFHSFPKNEDLRLKWYEGIRKKVYRNAYICSKHFKTEDYRNHEDPNLIRKLLKLSAVPNNKLCRELESIENSSFDTVDMSIGNNDNFEFVNHTSLEFKNSILNETSDNKLQINESSASTKVNNPATRKILDDKAKSYINQTKKRKTKDYYTLQSSVEKQGCQNAVCVSEVVRKEDFKNINAWSRFQKYINEMRKQCKFLLHKNRRLHLKLSNFKDMLETLRTK